jgi:hypothetical protein
MHRGGVRQPPRREAAPEHYLYVVKGAAIMVDPVNAVLAAAGDNFGLLLRWLALLRALLTTLFPSPAVPQHTALRPSLFTGGSLAG